jgi:hypothetical protein
MWNSHSSVGLAQSIFYFPAIFAAALLLFRRHGSPRMPWVALYAFSIGECSYLLSKKKEKEKKRRIIKYFPVRFVGGILFIVYTNNSSQVGWIIVAIIFEGAGVIPLLLVLVGFIRLMLVANRVLRLKPSY